MRKRNKPGGRKQKWLGGGNKMGGVGGGRAWEREQVEGAGRGEAGSAETAMPSPASVCTFTSLHCHR